MRAFALAAVAASLSLALVGTATARPWSDPAGRVLFDAPNGWTTSQERGATPTDTFTYVISGNANNECQIFAFAAPDTASANADLVRRQSADPARFSNDVWTQTLNSITAVFPGSSAQVLSTSVDTTGPWPIQLAEVQSPERLVHAALQMRPGFNLITLCMTYGGAEPMATYNAFIRSVAHPNDAAFNAAADQQAAQRGAQQQAQDQAQQAQQQQQEAQQQQQQQQQEEQQRRQRSGRLR